MNYGTQAAREAQAVNYGDKSYWDYIEASEVELAGKLERNGDSQSAKDILERSLSDALRGNDGD